MRKENKMTYIEETIQQLETHLTHLIDRAQQLGFIWEDTRGQLNYIATHRGCYPIDQILYTEQEKRIWNHTQQQDKQR